MSRPPAFRLLPLTLALCLLPLAPGSLGAAEPPTVAEVARRVQQYYEKVSDLSGRFEQTSSVLGSRKKRKARGTVKFKKPGMMRWDYTAPVEQSFISDGKKFYYYNAQEKFVAIKKLSQAFDSPTPSDFLNGLGRLDRAFRLAAPASGIVDSEGRYRLALTPKDPAGGSYTLTLILEPEAPRLYGVTYGDAMGSETLVRFLEMKENQGLPDGDFAFQIPAGVSERREF